MNAVALALKSSRALVVIFTGNANASRNVAQELERAADRNIPIVGLKVEKVEPSEELLERSKATSTSRLKKVPHPHRICGCP